MIAIAASHYAILNINGKKKLLRFVAVWYSVEQPHLQKKRYGHSSANPIWYTRQQALVSFDPAEKRALLKFVTSCERPPRLGFASLHPGSVFVMPNPIPSFPRKRISGIRFCYAEFYTFVPEEAHFRDQFL